MAVAPAQGSPASPDAAAGARPGSISVAMDLVVGPDATRITFLPKPTFGYAYAPLQLTVPATASSALANLAVINLGGPTSSSLPPGADSGGQPLTRGQGRWAMCGSFLQLKAEHSVARLALSSDTGPPPLTYVGSNSWPITASYKLQRVPNSNDQTAPAVLLLSGAPFFVVPDLLVTDALGA
ncbi:hypothetical protein HaLaN_02401 [Haematococcus lacustris]|uniref:Uncharacterized protein n=1 Tax=Haematococcus lacustris TaxID=44745 RepID=A0A699YDV0_HAELA|nr:hypothetical protein HaLaN_02401 [Haematococcus lacustris]